MNDDRSQHVYTRMYTRCRAIGYPKVCSLQAANKVRARYRANENENDAVRAVLASMPAIPEVCA